MLELNKLKKQVTWGWGKKGGGEEGRWWYSSEGNTSFFTPEQRASSGVSELPGHCLLSGAVHSTGTDLLEDRAGRAVLLYVTFLTLLVGM